MRIFKNSELVPDDELGFFYSCFDEKEAVDYSLRELRKHYPTNPIYLVSDGGADYSYLASTFDNIFVSQEEDTMSETFKITGENFKEEKYQRAIDVCAFTVLNRLRESRRFLKTKYVLMMHPDTLVRCKLSVPYGVKLLGSRANVGFPREFKKILRSTPGAKVINRWGATPGILEFDTFLKALNYIESNRNLFSQLSMAFQAMYAHDVLIPTLFALIGERETFNPDIIECLRDPKWESKNNPLVHQFRRYYPKR